MKVNTLGRKVNLRQSFIDKVDRRMQKLDRFFGDDAEGQVTATAERERMTVEITVRSKGLIYRAERTASDIDEAFGDAADLIVKQIVKNKEKLGARVKRAAVDAETAVYTDVFPDKDSEYNIAREKRFVLKPLTTEEAILQMNMLDLNFFVYEDADTEEICVVYKRRGNSYGVLVTER